MFRRVGLRPTAKLTLRRPLTAAEKLARGQPVNVWRADGSWDHEAEAALLDSTIRIFTPEELEQIVKGTF